MKWRHVVVMMERETRGVCAFLCFLSECMRRADVRALVEVCGTVCLQSLVGEINGGSKSGACRNKVKRSANARRAYGGSFTRWKLESRCNGTCEV